MNKKILSSLVSAAVVIASIGIANAYMKVDSSVPFQRFQNYDFFVSSSTNTTLNSTTTSATSTSIGIVPYFDSLGRLDKGYMNINGARNVTFYFGTVGSSTQSTVFSVQVSPDGTNWYNFNKLVQNVASTTNPGATISSQTVASTTVTIDSMDLRYDTFQAVRCIAVVTNAATSTCNASAAF